MLSAECLLTEQFLKALPIQTPSSEATFGDDRAVSRLGYWHQNQVCLEFLHQRRSHMQYRATTSPLVDIVLLPLSVRRSDFAPALAPNSELRYLFPLPIRVRLIVAVIGMESVGWHDETFAEVCSFFHSAIRITSAHFIPVSLATGDNITHRSTNMPWYEGPTLIEALAQPATAPYIPPSALPLLLLLSDAVTVEDAADAWVRVFRGKLRSGCTVFRVNEAVTVTKIHTHSGGACEGSIARITIHGPGAKACLLGDVLDEGDGKRGARCGYKTSLVCHLSLRELPAHCPLFTAGCEGVLRTHFAAAEVEVSKLLAMNGKKRPMFAKAKQQVACCITLKGPLWTMESSDGISRSGFELVLLESQGKVLGHGRVVPAPARKDSVDSIT